MARLKPCPFKTVAKKCRAWRSEKQTLVMTNRNIACAISNTFVIPNCL